MWSILIDICWFVLCFLVTLFRGLLNHILDLGIPFLFSVYLASQLGYCCVISYMMIVWCWAQKKIVHAILLQVEQLQIDTREAISHVRTLSLTTRLFLVITLRIQALINPKKSSFSKHKTRQEYNRSKCMSCS